MYCRARFWLLSAYAVSVGAIIGSVAVMLHYASLPDGKMCTLEVQHGCCPASQLALVVLDGQNRLWNADGSKAQQGVIACSNKEQHALGVLLMPPPLLCCLQRAGGRGWPTSSLSPAYWAARCCSSCRAARGRRAAAWGATVASSRWVAD